jgi:hypothetical protein
MRTIPMVVTSSVEVVSTERAHRMQRSTSTEAIGRAIESMLRLWPELEEDESESEADDCADDVELEDPKWWLEGLADMVKVGRRIGR